MNLNRITYTVVRESRITDDTYPLVRAEEAYQVCLDGKPVATAEIVTTSEFSEVHDIEIIASWELCQQPLVNAILDKIDILGLANQFGAGLGLTGRLVVLPGLLTIHLSQKAQTVAVAAPVAPAEAVCDVAYEPLSKAA